MKSSTIAIAKSRLQQVVSHVSPFSSNRPKAARHELCPTFFLSRAAILEPNAEAIVHKTVNGKFIRRNYADFSRRSMGLAYYLVHHGYKRVGLLMVNTPAYLEGIFGIGGAGAVQVGINYRLRKDDIAYIFDHAEVDCILVDREYLPLLEEFKGGAVRKIVDEDCGEGIGDFEDCINEGLRIEKQVGGKGWDGLPWEPKNEDDTIALAYTSGTTAKPKGVEYTHRGVYLAALANIVESGFNVQTPLTRERAKYLSILPFFHATGWTVYWSVVAVRGTHFCLRKVDYPEIWRILKEEGITHYNAAPTVNATLCSSIAAERLPHQVRVTVAASPPSAKLFEDMIKLNLIPVHVYGLTETYGPITKGYFLPEWHQLSPSEMYPKMARQGHGFITSKNVRVIKLDIFKTTGELVDVTKDGKEIGEIVFTGNICSQGYYKDPASTKKLFEGGALHSGDLAVWHMDGSIQVLDRLKDIIISGGENISSVGLEALLERHPDIFGVGVVGIPDAKYGERPKAYVTLKTKSIGKSPPVTGRDIIEWAKQKENGIASFMVPKEIEIVDELPMTSTGKVRKNILREWAKGAKRER